MAERLVPADGYGFVPLVPAAALALGTVVVGGPDGREGLCHGKEYTCAARKALGTDFCIGHLRSNGMVIANDEG